MKGPGLSEISSILDDLRGQFPACSSIAYADLSAGMILAVSSDSDVPQETWDDLCATAVELLTGSVADQVSGLLSAGGGVCQAIISQDQELGVFVKSGANDEDAFACICAPDIGVQGFVASAHAQLDQIAADG